MPAPDLTPRYEHEAFLTRQLITCLGNKRALLDFIGQGVAYVRKRLDKQKLILFDVFSGSGIVARYFKQYADLLMVNDLENYSALVNHCYLSNREDIDMPRLKEYYAAITAALLRDGLCKGIIAEHYAPGDERNILAGDRVFYTIRNAMYIDTVRQLIAELPPDAQKYFLAPLLSEASVHVNTSGVFKGFYKDTETGAGRFGGKNGIALSRITGDIALPFPVFSNFSAEVRVYQGDANQIIAETPEADIAYLDPPYNQHPYGSNYFMLNLILDYASPQNISRVSGIPGNWNRSAYNKARSALLALTDLVSRIRAKYTLVSFNSEGFISPGEMQAMLSGLGKVEVLETRYNTFRGSRNLNKRSPHVKEYLYILEK
jgi:adenine-specific DNA-methyltransferase